MAISSRGPPKDIALDKLAGLKQAVGIAELMRRGQRLLEIIKNNNGDEQAVMIWVNFLKDIHWVEETPEGGLIVTPIGIVEIAKYK